jgi:hypothetical protein
VLKVLEVHKDRLVLRELKVPEVLRVQKGLRALKVLKDV